jgi:hypothetical protein
MSQDNNELAKLIVNEGGKLPVSTSLTRTQNEVTIDHGLWAAIRNRTDAIRSDSHITFIDRVLNCNDEFVGTSASKSDHPNSKAAKITSKEVSAPSIKERRDALSQLPVYGVDAYNLLKLATQAFLLLEAGVVIKERSLDGTTARLPNTGAFVHGEESRLERSVTAAQLEGKLREYLGGSLPGSLPYLKRIVRALVDTDDPETSDSPYVLGILRERFSSPSMLELIWSYWHEEGMLVQTMNAICLRFQNRRGPLERDPLANLEIDPLRPLNNLLWGYIQDEYNRLTVPRRAYEYDHHYGLKMVGKAVPELRSADSRSKFIEAFHNLLQRTAAFYREDADTTVIADGFSLLSSLREVHLLLAEGAHNQFGDLPWTSRIEMLMMQWFLSRPEMREFLRGRVMVPYEERWMGQVDTMKRLQGWGDTSITHFRSLGVYGEQILLSIRYGDWSSENNQDHAKTWARYWRPEIQGYIHAYLAATGVNLAEDVVDLRSAPTRYIQPSTLLQNRLSAQTSRGELPSTNARSLSPSNLSFGSVAGSRRRALNPRKE